MDHPPEGSLHPNIARIAAEYDRIREEFRAKRVSAGEARALVEQLEARDDNGVRWSIDSVSGRWIRKDFNGDTLFDTPPTFGVQTDDAYSYSSTRGGASDVNLDVELYATSQAPQMNLHMPGAVENGPTTSPRETRRVLDVLIPATAAVLALVVLALLLL